MKRIVKILMLMSVVLLASVSCEEESTLSVDDASEVVLDDITFKSKWEPINGQYIVTLKKGTFTAPIDIRNTALKGSSQKNLYLQEISVLKNELSSPNASLKSNGVSFGFDGQKIKTVFRYALEGFVANLTEEEAARLRLHPNVVSVVSDQFVILKKPDNPGNGGGGGGEDPAPQQVIPWGITRVGGAGDGTGKTAWVIDSGIDLDHVDLSVDVSRSLSFTGDNNPDDGNGHGTHVAGTIAALDNNVGVVGVAAGADVVALKVLNNSGSGDFSWTVQALDYVTAVGSPGDVANMSLGPSSPYIEPITDQATMNLAATGVNVTIAAGNNYDDASLYTPARNNHPNIYTISACAPGDFFATFSNYGSPVDYAAPGYQVNSTWNDGGYNTINGTSMAAPHAAGVLLLGNPNSSGNVIGGYWEVKGIRLTGNVSATNDFNTSVYRYDVDGNNDPIIHR